jgi:hypothetical protein
LSCFACVNNGIDRNKFGGVDASADALRAEVSQSGGSGSSRFPELLTRFRTEIAALDGRTAGSRERAVLSAYAHAAEAYEYFWRFELLEREAIGGMVLLRGRNRPIASRYQLPMANRGGGRWVRRQDAMKTFSDRAERELTTAVALLAGE